jgi:hypothetical protein
VTQLADIGSVQACRPPAPVPDIAIPRDDLAYRFGVAAVADQAAEPARAERPKARNVPRRPVGRPRTRSTARRLRISSPGSRHPGNPPHRVDSGRAPMPADRRSVGSRRAMPNKLSWSSSGSPGPARVDRPPLRVVGGPRPPPPLSRAVAGRVYCYPSTPQWPWPPDFKLARVLAPDPDLQPRDAVPSRGPRSPAGLLRGGWPGLGQGVGMRDW